MKVAKSLSQVSIHTS